MESGRAFDSSVIIEDYFASPIPKRNTLIASTPLKIINLIRLGNEFAWEGSLESLKQFIKDDLNIEGKWSSPGGETKLFTSANCLMKWYGKSRKKLIIVKDDGNQSLLEKLSKFATMIEDKLQGDDENGGMECDLTVHKIVENLSADDGENTKLYSNNRNSITNSESKETIPEIGDKSINSQCCCNELAVQVNRIEGDIKLLKSQMDIRKAGEDILGCSTVTCLSEKTCLRKDLDKANTLIKELKSKIKCLEEEKSSLTTIIRIIQEDNPQRTKLNCSKNGHADEKFIEVKNIGSLGRRQKNLH